MTMTATKPVKLPPDQTPVATRAERNIRRYLTDHRGASQIEVTVEDGGREPLTLPREAVELLAGMLAHLGAGRTVSVVHQDTELTTQQAADMLNVSRPYLIGLLDAGEIEYGYVGTHRRIKASSLMEYKRQDDERRRAAADELTQLDQEMGFI